MNHGRAIEVLKQAAIYKAAELTEKQCAVKTAKKYMLDDQKEVHDFVLYHFATVERIARKIPLLVHGITEKEF